MRAGFEANHAVQAGNPHLSYTIVNGKAVTKKAPNRGAAVPAAISPRSEVMVRRYWGRGRTIKGTMLSARTPRGTALPIVTGKAAAKKVP